MDVFEVIDKRRTIRVFKQAASEEQVRKLLVAGAKAPSGSNVQPWEFIIIDDPAIIEQIADHKYQQTLKMAIDEVVLKNPEVLEQIYRQNLQQPFSPQPANRQKGAYQNCAVVAVCNRKWHGSGRKTWMNIENIASVWMCIENMALAAAADGLGMQISIFREEHKAAVEKLLCLPDDCELATMVLFGVAEAYPEAREFGKARDDFRWLHRNKFGVS